MAKKYICPACENGYASSQSLWNHKQRCQGQSAPRKRVCDDDSYNVAEPKTYCGTTVKSPIRNTIGYSKDIKLEGKFLSPEKSLEYES